MLMLPASICEAPCGRSGDRILVVPGLGHLNLAINAAVTVPNHKVIASPALLRQADRIPAGGSAVMHIDVFPSPRHHRLWVWNTTSSDSGESSANKLRHMEVVNGGGASTSSRMLVKATMPTRVTKTATVRLDDFFFTSVCPA